MNKKESFNRQKKEAERDAIFALLGDENVGAALRHLTDKQFRVIDGYWSGHPYAPEVGAGSVYRGALANILLYCAKHAG